MRTAVVISNFFFKCVLSSSLVTNRVRRIKLTVALRLASRLKKKKKVNRSCQFHLFLIFSVT